MSLAWSKTARVYLSRKLVLAQLASQPIVELRFAGDVPLVEMLPQVELAFAQGTRIEVHLSAALCPLVAVDYPTGIHRLAEKEVYALSVCAVHLGVRTEELQVDLDATQPTIAAPMMKSDLEALREWLLGKSCRLTSVQPLWAVLSKAPATRSWNAVALQEPDAITLVGNAASPGSIRALTLALAGQDEPAALLQRMHQALSLARSETHTVRFGTRSDAAFRDGPDVWTGYWTSA